MTVITIGCGNYDRTRPLADGRTRVGGYEVRLDFRPPSELFPLAVKEAPFEVSELSSSSQLVQVARGSNRYIALPVFLARSFRYDAIYIRSDRGIASPADLAGKRVGVPEYQMTMAVWIRGLLQDEYGLDFRTLHYVTGGINEPGRKERIPLQLPPEIKCAPAPENRSLNDLLRDGEIDALMSPYPPKIFIENTHPVRRLFASPAEQERAYFRKTGIYPIMHVLGIRKDILARHPDLPASLLAAFADAREIALDDIRRMRVSPASPLMLPWLSETIDHAFDVMGDDPWPYGLERNKKEIEALCRYVFEQHLTDRLVAVEELFPLSL